MKPVTIFTFGPFFTFLLVLLAFTTGIAQSDTLNSITKSIQLQHQNILTEKIFAHLDRSFYMKGETMWFKIWTMDASSGKRVNLSKVAYVELLDIQSKSVLQLKILLQDGKGNGSVELPTTLASGNYTFRAYTAYMKNFSAEFFFHQNICLVNPDKRPLVSQEKNKENYSVAFLPEGGHLVGGIESRIGFKATDGAGKGTDFLGSIINAAGDTIQQFKPFKFGMGNFTLKPSTEEKYHVVCVFPDKTKIITALPAISGKGYGMRLSEVNEKNISVEVTSSGMAEAENFYLIAHRNGKTEVAMHSLLLNGKCRFLLEKTKLGKGISCLTLFNSQKLPVCERLYFTIPDDTLPASFANFPSTYNTRDKVSLPLQIAQHENERTEQSNLSVAVFLLDSLQPLPECNITNYVWLTSELKGWIESPQYYFQSDSSSKEALENLLLTQGWRRFDWTEVLKNKPFNPEFLPDLEKPSLQAKIIEKRTGLPAPGIQAYLSIPSAKNYFYTSKSNQYGNITFPLRPMEGLKELILQLQPSLNSDFQIQLKDEFSKSVEKKLFLEMVVPSLSMHDLQTRFVNSNVDFAFRKQQGQIPASFREDSLLFYGVPDRTYLLDKYTRFTTMEEVIREYVYEVLLKKQKDKFECFVYNAKTKTLFPEEPLYLIDGLPFFKANDIIHYNPLNIKKIEIIERKYFYGPLVSNGILSFFTYKHDLKDFKIDSSATVIDFTGIEKSRQFYSPTYVPGEKSNFPDFRNLMYWNPEVNTEGKNHTIEFYTSDQPGTYAIVVNGISTSGRTASLLKTIEVKAAIKN